MKLHKPLPTNYMQLPFEERMRVLESTANANQARTMVAIGIPVGILLVIWVLLMGVLM